MVASFFFPELKPVLGIGQGREAGSEQEEKGRGCLRLQREAVANILGNQKLVSWSLWLCLQSGAWDPPETLLEGSGGSQEVTYKYTT